MTSGKIKSVNKSTLVPQRKYTDNFQSDYPLFSFKYLRPNSIKKAKDPKFFYEFLMRLKELSEQGWKGIRESSRHHYGMEKIPRNQIKCDLTSVGDILTDDIQHLDVFRATKDNHPFLGIQVDKVFHILFIEAKFGDIYNHS